MPLHLAAFNRAPERLLLWLIAEHPAACQAPNGDGWLPLHLAMRYHAPRAATEAMIRAAPKAAALKAGTSGWLPLHLGLRFGSPCGMAAHGCACAQHYWHSCHAHALTAVILSHPGACAVPTPHGWLPIHLAARFRAGAHRCHS
jgi:hypothetical protein